MDFESYCKENTRRNSATYKIDACKIQSRSNKQWSKYCHASYRQSLGEYCHVWHRVDVVPHLHDAPSRDIQYSRTRKAPATLKSHPEISHVLMYSKYTAIIGTSGYIRVRDDGRYNRVVQNPNGIWERSVLRGLRHGTRHLSYV